MCRQGMGRPATRAASCSAADSGRTASGKVRLRRRDHVPLHMRSIAHRNRPSPEPILYRATKRLCFCELLVAATTDRRRAALARVLLHCWPTLIRRLEVPCTSEKRANTKFDWIPSQPEVSRPQRKRDRGGIVPATTAHADHTSRLASQERCNLIQRKLPFCFAEERYR